MVRIVTTMGFEVKGAAGHNYSYFHESLLP